MGSPQGKKHLVHGKLMTIRDAANEYKISIHAIRNRMYNKDLTLEEAVDYNPNEHDTTNKGNSEWQSLKGGARLSVDDI